MDRYTKLVSIVGASDRLLLNGSIEPIADRWAADQLNLSSVHWGPVRLGDLGRWSGGGTPSKLVPSFWVDGTIPWISPKDMKRQTIDSATDYITATALSNSSAKLIPTGSVLVVVRSGILSHTLPVAVTLCDVALNQDIKAITPGKRIIATYLALYLQAFELDILKRCVKAGTTVSSIDMQSFLAYTVPLPALEDQLRIVEEIEAQLSRLEAGVSALKRAQANLKRYRAAVQKAACEGKLVPQEAHLACAENRTYESGDQLLTRIITETKGKPGRRTVSAENPELPVGWTRTPIGDLFNCIVPNRDKPKSFTGHIPWVTLPDFGESIYVGSASSKLGLTDAEVDESRAKVIPSGSVVMSCIGRFGLAAVLKHDSVINQQLHAFLVPKWLSAEFIAYALRTQQSYMESIATSTTIAYLNKRNCNSLHIPLPPLAEQERIVAEVERRLSVVDQLEATIDANLRRATRLRQSILQKAFSGPAAGAA